MELSSSIFSEILSPLAAFIDPLETEAGSDETLPDIQNNTNASTTLPQQQTWRLDGIDIDGIRFFAIPTFAINKPPLRVDVYIPPHEEHPRHVRQSLKTDATMYTTDKQSAITLPISQHLLLALTHWSSTLPDFENLYLSLPFGSQIVVTDLTLDPVTTSAGIQLVPNYSPEQAMIPLPNLVQTWSSTPTTWPPALDTTSLLFSAQIHEAITLVTIPSSPDPTRQYVFKSLLRDQKYLYNELKNLLSLPPHPNLVPSPRYVVTHKCRFGGKRGVAGFVLEYFPLGSLAAYLSSPTAVVETADKFRWARQVTSALAHVNAAGGFYPDLKGDNVVLRQDTKEDGGKIDAVLLDLEQRGGWFSWSPPEVAYVEYVEVLASRADDRKVSAEMAELLTGYIPAWTPPGAQEERYRGDVSGGFSAPWLALAEERRRGGVLGTLLERAQVFMLGKMLWCIFEGCAVVRCGVDHELLRDPDPPGSGGFPEFKATPEEMRNLIRACTAGAREWKGLRRGVVLRKGRLVPASWEGKGEVPSAGETRDVAREWWAGEVETAKEFVKEIAAVKRGLRYEKGGVLRDALNRPLLGEVLELLKHIEDSVLRQTVE